MDVWELCTAYFVPANHLNRGSLATLSSHLNMPFGTIHRAPPNNRDQIVARPSRKKEKKAPPPIEFPWHTRAEVTVAGSAGQRIRSALGVIGELAVAGGLHVAQQDDFPITVRKGFSVSSLIISPEPILYVGLDHPDLVVVLSEDGLHRVGDLTNEAHGALVVADQDLSIGSTPARLVRINPSSWNKDVSRESIALAAVAFALVCAGWISGEALLAAAQAGFGGAYRDENLQAVCAGIAQAQREASSVPSVVSGDAP